MLDDPHDEFGVPEDRDERFSDGKSTIAMVVVILIVSAAAIFLISILT